MNIPTQSQLCVKIIRENLSWSVLDSDGRSAHKPPDMDDLTTLLICHKMGTFKIVAGEPLPPKAPLLVKITVEGGVAHVTECPQGVEVEIADLDGDADEPGESKAYMVDHTLTERSVG